MHDKLFKNIEKLERAKGFEPSTPTLARRPTGFSWARLTCI